MGIINQLLSGSSGLPEYSDPNELRTIWNSYCNNWPDNNQRYDCWKPASVLPAPKWAVKQAIKLCYAEWPMPIDWDIFACFFMEYVDLALHLPQEKYDIIKNFSKQRIMCGGKEYKTDPLLTFKLSSTLAVSSPID